MYFMKNIIEDIENLRTNHKGEQYGYFCVNGGVEENEMLIDTLDICKELAYYEVDCDTDIIYDTIEDENESEEILNRIFGNYNEYEDDYAEKYLELLNELGYVDFSDWCGDNTYNWSAPVSNDINFEIYHSLIDDGVYVCFKVHRYGDVRGNYTDSCILHFDDENEWYEAFDETRISRDINIDNKQYTIETEFWSEGHEVYNDGCDYVCTVYSTDIDEAIEEIKDKIQD